MGILGVIGVFILLGTHFGLLSVTEGWYYFWLLMAVLNVLNQGLSGRSK